MFQTLTFTVRTVTWSSCRRSSWRCTSLAKSTAPRRRRRSRAECARWYSIQANRPNSTSRVTDIRRKWHRTKDTSTGVSKGNVTSKEISKAKMKSTKVSKTKVTGIRLTKTKVTGIRLTKTRSLGIRLTKTKVKSTGISKA